MNQLERHDVPKKIFIFIFYFFTMYILGAVISLWLVHFVLFPLFPDKPFIYKNFGLALTNFLIYATLFITFIIALKEWYIEEFKRSTKKLGTIIGIAFLGWLSMLALNGLIETILQLFGFEMRESINQETVKESLLKFPYLTIPVVILGAPLIEETVFRGVIFNGCRNLKLPYKLNLILAFFLSSVLFGLIHVALAFLDSGDSMELVLGISYAVTGLVFTVIYYLTNNLYTAIIAHFIQNTFATIVILFVPLDELFPEAENVIYMLGRLLHII